jgi:hypothetical protein
LANLVAHSLDDLAGDGGLPDDVKRLLDDRLAEVEAAPGNERSWDEFSAELALTYDVAVRPQAEGDIVAAMDDRG